MTDIYLRYAGEEGSFRDAVRLAKRQVLTDSFGAELRALTRLALEAARENVEAFDFSASDIRAVLLELLADLPVYRVYVRAEDDAAASDAGDTLSEQERQALSTAADAARAHLPEWRHPLIEFVISLLTRRAGCERGVTFARRFGQLSGPAVAKGVEDTAFYRCHRLISLNESAAILAASARVRRSSMHGAIASPAIGRGHCCPARLTMRSGERTSVSASAC
jgi:(1->4)-alpha-D-glucan 1-alpha-D-glucosylmutase